MDAKIASCERHHGQILEVSLNAPKANVLDAAMMAQLRSLLAVERAGGRRKAIVLQGAGAHFCFGASVPEHAPGQVQAMLPQFHALIDDLLDHPLPILARVSGNCLGGGFELALACSLLFADASARFAVPEIQLGVFPPVATVLLPALGAGALGMRLILSGQAVDATALDAAGLLAAQLPTTAGTAALDDWLQRHLLPHSAAALRIAHRAARAPLLAHWRAHIRPAEQLYLGELMATHDAREGIAAFIERRPPRWQDA